MTLTKTSNPSDIERYFRGVLELDKQNKEFSVNLDDVWQLCYAKKSKVANFYTLLMKLWRERWKCERAKVNYCKRKITSRQLVDAMNHAEKEESEISDKISELTKELDELYDKK